MNEVCQNSKVPSFQSLKVKVKIEIDFSIPFTNKVLCVQFFSFYVKNATMSTSVWCINQVVYLRFEICGS